MFPISILRIIIGSFVFFWLPGIYLVRIIFRRNRLNAVEHGWIAVILSMITVPLIGFFIHKINPLLFPLNSLTALLLYTVVIIILAIVDAVMSKVFYRQNEVNYLWVFNHKTFLLISSVFVYCLLIFFIINRQGNIISPDASYFFSAVKEALNSSKYPEWRANLFPLVAEGYQPMMQSQIIFLNLLTGIDLTFLFRFGMVWIFGIGLIIGFYNVINTYSDDARSQLSLLTLFSVPMLIMEMSFVRPQTFIYVLSPFVIFLLYKLIKTKYWYEWLIVLLITIATGWKLHYTILVFLPLLVLGLIIKYRLLSRSNKKIFLVMTLLSTVAIIPYLDTNFWIHINFLFGFFRKSYAGFNPFRNYFGVVTYAANIAFLLPYLSILFVYFYILKKILIDYYIILVLSFCFIYILILEILPRLGFLFLPSRAFPLLSIGLILLTPVVIGNIQKYPKLLKVGIFLWIGSIAATIYVNFLPTFYTINHKEIEAIKYINNQQGVSLVVTQFGNFPAINEYGNFWVIDLLDENLVKYFNEDTLNPQLIKIFSNYKNYDESLIKERNKLVSLTVDQNNNFNIKQLALAYNDLCKNYLKRFETLDQEINNYNYLFKGKNHKQVNIYILYSKVKKKSFFSRYDWWYGMNFIPAKLDKFERSPYFEKVFDNNDVSIYRYIDSPNK